MEFKLLLKLIINLVKNPNKTWAEINSKKYNSRDISTNFLTPIVILGCTLKLIGRYTSLKDYSILNSILSFTTFIIISFSIIYITAWVINELLPKFKSDKNFTAIFTLISFSSFPTIISSSLASLNTNLSFLHIASIYSIILFWIGTTKLLQIPKEHLTGFVLISIIIIATVSLIISFLIMSIFLSIFLNF